jgi:hypothetical protein
MGIGIAATGAASGLDDGEPAAIVIGSSSRDQHRARTAS